MLDRSDLDTLISQVSSPILLSSVATDNKYIYNFELKGRKRNWNISLDFSYGFPNTLPIVKLLDTNEVGRIAHVNSICTICIEESDSVLIDKDRPVEILEYYLCDIKHTLDRSSLIAYRDELMDEYEGYFYPDILNKEVNSFYTTDTEVEEIYIKISHITKDRDIFGKSKTYAYPILILDKKELYSKDYSNVKEINATIINAIHVPLSEKVLPPSEGKKFSLDYLQSILKNLSAGNKTKLSKILHKTKENKQFFLLLSIPRSSDLRTEILIEFSSKNRLQHPLLEYTDEWTIDIYSINRHSKEYLLERGGAENGLNTKIVTIVGCGSVGGEIAYMLAKAGIGNLFLVDHDRMHTDNIYRHRVGGGMLDYMPNNKTGRVTQITKTSALKYLLEKDLPHINVEVRSKKFEQVIDEDFLEKSDMIIVAIGSPMPSFIINEELKKKEITNVIFCWNEAANYGGHSVLLNLHENCLQCLYTTVDGSLSTCKLSLVKPSKNISKNLTGCAGVFTPFSYLDSSQTALLASKQCIKVLSGFKGSIATSWKGEGNQELENTARYEEIGLIEEIELRRDKKCKVCNVW